MNYKLEYTDYYNNFKTKAETELHGGLHTISPALAFSAGDRVQVGRAFYKLVFRETLLSEPFTGLKFARNSGTASYKF